MSIFYASKQPSEVIPVEIRYERLLASGETVTILDVKVYDSTGQDVTVAMLVSSTISGGAAGVAVIQAGTDGEKYKVTFKATTSNSYVYEDDVALSVLEM